MIRHFTISNTTHLFHVLMQNFKKSIKWYVPRPEKVNVHNLEAKNTLSTRFESYDDGLTVCLDFELMLKSCALRLYIETTSKQWTKLLFNMSWLNSTPRVLTPHYLCGWRFEHVKHICMHGVSRKHFSIFSRNSEAKLQNY